MIEKPPPGSNEAYAQGCICPILDNGHGTGAWMVNGMPMFWIDENCPLHSSRPAIEGHTQSFQVPITGKQE